MQMPRTITSSSSHNSTTGVEDILLERRLSNDFRWCSRHFEPCSYFVRGRQKSPTQLIEAVLASEDVSRVIAELSNESGKSQEEIRKLAKSIMIELAHDFHMCAIRWFGLTLSKLAKTIYNGIQVNTDKILQIKETYKSYPVLLLPTHRSYVDFLLISFMSFHFDLALPIIAAGMDFMSMAGIGEMLRKSGAFFIRRTFGGDRLYWSVVSEYVRTATLKGGHPLEMFIEGTRSRSGKSLQPKLGLLTAVLELVRTSQVPDLLILPIAMSYDRTLEETLYAHELLGKPKPRESTNGLVKALRWIGSQSYGNVYLNFGNPISFREILEREIANCTDTDQSGFTTAVQNIAMETILSHQKHLLIPIFAGVSLVFLSKVSRGSRSMHFYELTSGVQHLLIFLRSRGFNFGFPLKDETLEANLRHLLVVHAGILVSGKNDIISIVNEPDETVFCMKLQHYANQILPQLLPFCLVSLLLLEQEGTEASHQIINSSSSSSSSNESESTTNQQVVNFVEEYTFLRRLFAGDFIYQRESEVEELNLVLSVLGPNTKFGQDLEPVKRILRHGIEPYLIGYWGVSKVLLESTSTSAESAPPSTPSTSFELKQLGKICQSFISQQILKPQTIQLPKQFGALSLETLGNGALAFVAAGAAKKIKLPNGQNAVVVDNRQRLLGISARLEKLVQESSNYGKEQRVTMISKL